jgi:hypothetical protein
MVDQAGVEPVQIEQNVNLLLKEQNPFFIMLRYGLDKIRGLT